jgi:hypothetical protein
MYCFGCKANEFTVIGANRENANLTTSLKKTHEKNCIQDRFNLFNKLSEVYRLRIKGRQRGRVHISAFSPHGIQFVQRGLSGCEVFDPRYVPHNIVQNSETQLNPLTAQPEVSLMSPRQLTPSNKQLRSKECRPFATTPATPP